jgi:ABC-type taurine transport system ATPase subunit
MARLTTRVGLASGTTVLAVGMAMATPSTLIWVPSGDVQPAGTIHLGCGRHDGPGAEDSVTIQVGWQRA